MPTGTSATGEFIALILLPGLVAATSKNRTLASFSAALALLGTSATMVELLGGAITAHFGFFVGLAFIALYQSWPVYLLAVAFTAVHHVGMADPTTATIRAPRAAVAQSNWYAEKSNGNTWRVRSAATMPTTATATTI